MASDSCLHIYFIERVQMEHCIQGTMYPLAHCSTSLYSPSVTPIQKRKKRYKVLGQNLIKPRQHSCSIVKVLNSASEMKILQDVTDLWTMNITFYKEKLNPLSSLMTGATYWCKKQTAIVLVSDRQRNAASQKLSSPMILALYFIHVWTGVSCEL